MLYLLDANVLIDASRDYYPIERIPEFWDWLLFMGDSGTIKIPYEIYGEITAGDDLLTTWIRTAKDSLVLDEEVNSDLIRKAYVEGYGGPLSDVEIAIPGKDPFLIAYAMAAADRCIVTTERSKPSWVGAKRKLPDAAGDFDIICINTYRMIQNLDFSTGWGT